MTLLHELLAHMARTRGSATALICEGRASSFAELDRTSTVLAAYLQARGVRRGDRVAVFLENCLEAVVGLFGALKAGAAFIMVNASTKDHKLAYILNDCEVSAIVAGPAQAGVLAQVLPEAPSVRRLIWAAPAAEGAPAGELLADILARPAALRDPGVIDQDLCAIIYTSGSTGSPKGVMLTHHNVLSAGTSIAQYLENTPSDVVLCVLPLSFGYGLCQILTSVLVGHAVVLERSFAYPYRVLEHIPRYRVTGMPAVPTIFASLLQMAGDPHTRSVACEGPPPLSGLDFSSLRYMTNAAAALPPAHIRRFREVFPHVRLFSMYGQTECLRVCYLDPALLDRWPASVGKAIPNCEAYVVDEQGRRLGPGQIGELVVRGGNVMRGYWRKPQETAQRLRDGEIPGEEVLHTGDSFYTDADGLLYFVGRGDEVFKCKGEKVSPREVENVLYELPEVAAAAVVGVEDPIDGQAVKAFVVPRDGAALTEARIRQHCRAHLEAHLVPKFVEIRSALPKTESGKIRKRSLVKADAPA